MIRSRLTIGLWGLSAVLLAVGATFLYAKFTARSSERLIVEARRKLAGGKSAEAETLARKVLSRDPRHGHALLVAAEAALSQKHPQRALEYYALVPDDCSPAALAGRLGAGAVLVDQGRLSEGEQKYRQALACDPQQRESHLRLAYLLGITGRRWESVEHLLAVVRSGRFPAEHLLYLGDVERVIDKRRVLTKCRQAAPDDPLPLLGEARIAVVSGDLPEARRLLERVALLLPEENEAQARLGNVLLDLGQDEEFSSWLARLRPAADEHPEIWVVRGLWFLKQQDPRKAARCLWEAVRRDPDHRQANYRLGTTLAGMDDRTQAAPFLERAERLEAFAFLIDDLFRNPHHTGSMREASELALALGRVWEAWGWALLARGDKSRPAWAEETVARLAPQLGPDLPRTVPEQNPALKTDLSSYPLPSPGAAPGSAAPRPGLSPARIQVRFADIAAEAGIDFVYFNGHDSGRRATRIIESTGGGVAAIDYDGDLWPDLYFTQGCRQPHVGPLGEHRDKLFRNLGDGRAADVTKAAGLGDEQFSQGISAGDYDNDGFSDLYLGNIGCNRLYRNNGDGTFSDATAAAGIRDNDWTTSCLIADLNGDSWPDIYDVNFCSGPDVFTLMCSHGGIARSCSPQSFEAAPDRVYLNRGDGTFEDVTGSAGIDAPKGYGLGIVAADFERTGKLNLFIANDGTANFYFVNRTDPRDGRLRFDEQALVAGLAFDADGLPQACMGVAAGDADGNGLVDLHVTNFYDEPDALYLQQAPGLFVDMIRAAGLYTPSFRPLGFGTQFVDGELDGLPDLVVANGHVEDASDMGQEYAMSPQYYRNLGGAKFVELAPASLGAFFEGKYLGRGLARLDWDRDGKEDFAVSNMGSPAALVVNRTPQAGHFLALKFRGVVSDRDAVGTTVRVTAGGQTRTSQLTAGDGYHASNERRIVVGLGEADRVQKLEIRWLSGAEQTFSDLPVDAEFLLIEGQSELLHVPTGAGSSAR